MNIDLLFLRITKCLALSGAGKTRQQRQTARCATIQFTEKIQFPGSMWKCGMSILKYVWNVSSYKGSHTHTHTHPDTDVKTEKSVTFEIKTVTLGSCLFLDKILHDGARWYDSLQWRIQFSQLGCQPVWIANTLLCPIFQNLHAIERNLVRGRGQH